jgi:hypothetical protein
MSVFYDRNRECNVRDVQRRVEPTRGFSAHKARVERVRPRQLPHDLCEAWERQCRRDKVAARNGASITSRQEEKDEGP